MKNLTRHIGRLMIVSRLDSSNNGNPRYLVMVDNTTARTPVDSMLGYNVPNLEDKQVEAIIGTHYGVATLASVKLV